MREILKVLPECRGSATESWMMCQPETGPTIEFLRNERCYATSRCCIVTPTERTDEALRSS